MSSFKALTFDVGYTLFNDFAMVRSALPKAVEWLRQQGYDIDEKVFQERFFHFDCTLDDYFYSHTYGEPDVWAAVLRDLQLPETLLEPLLDEYRWHLLSEMGQGGQETDALRWAKEQGYLTCLLTNERLVRINIFIDHAGMRPFIDAQIVSEEAGCGKPEDEFFRLGLNRLGVEGKDCVHFGDNEITDGACKDLGMKFVLVEGYKNPECTWGRGNKIYEPDARIDRLTPESMQQVLRELENRNN